MPTHTVTVSDYDDSADLYNIVREAAALDLTDTSAEEEELLAPVFLMQENTQSLELRALQERYPRQIFNQNFQLPVREALRTQRNAIREAIHEVRKIQAVRIAIQDMPRRFRPMIETVLGLGMSSRNMRFATAADASLETTSAYRTAISRIEHYQILRQEFKRDTERFSSVQARYNQEAALIRQRPRTSVPIDCEQIMHTLSQWEHIWGVSAYHDTSDNLLYFRIGLCGITMEESATVSRYDEPTPISLAPFFFTLRLTADGQFLCRSTGGNTLGLSRHELGGMSYDVHPHQLSDTPCFGTFGQSFIDMAARGDVISLVGGIIAFYSQYNSQDSAGVEARRYHPAMFCNIYDSELYHKELHDGLEQFSVYNRVDSAKLVDAIAAYMTYFTETRDVGEDAPRFMQDHTCADCGDEPVNDDCDYYIANDERICVSCWEDHYCGDCERHQEDCICSDDDRY